jgi:predicted Zn-dependent protease
VQYSVGSIDAGFKLTPDELRLALAEAESLWEKATDTNLFQHTAKGGVSVSLQYDTRQATTQKNNTLKESITNTSDTAESVRKEYESVQHAYDVAKKSYEASGAKYNKDLAAYNTKVEYWNTRGGAPPAEYKVLQAQKAALGSQEAVLESKRIVLNAQIEQINVLSQQYNKLAQAVNKTVDTINRTAGREFEEGLFTKNALGAKIEIFEYSTHAELVRVLAHELGHSLGLLHNSNPDSIMYELNESKNSKPTKEDLSSLREVCRL